MFRLTLSERTMNSLVCYDMNKVCPVCAASWSNMEQALIKLAENLGSVTNQTLKSKLEECVLLAKR